mmetsp:Transcript_89740/g.231692  ORF Transcript_89740/g.231692 Transcript_89740/m.231692 type:complete len:553 (-) Transcript_89740:2-1660(-)
MASLQSSRSLVTASFQPSESVAKRTLCEGALAACTSLRADCTMPCTSSFVSSNSCRISRSECCSSCLLGESPPPMVLCLLMARWISDVCRCSRPAIIRSNRSTSPCRALASSSQRRASSIITRSTALLTRLRSWPSFSSSLRSLSSSRPTCAWPSLRRRRSSAAVSPWSCISSLKLPCASRISALRASTPDSMFRTLFIRACSSAERSFASCATRRWAWCTALVLRPSAAARSCCSCARAWRRSEKCCRSSKHSARQEFCTPSTLAWVCTISLRRRALDSCWLAASERNSAWSSWRSCLSMASPCSRWRRSSPMERASSVMPCCSAEAVTSWGCADLSIRSSSSAILSSTVCSSASRAERSFLSVSFTASRPRCSSCWTCSRLACSCSSARRHRDKSAFWPSPDFAMASWSERKPHCRCRSWSTRRLKSCITPSVSFTTTGSPVATYSANESSSCSMRPPCAVKSKGGFTSKWRCTAAMRSRMLTTLTATVSRRPHTCTTTSCAAIPPAGLARPFVRTASCLRGVAAAGRHGSAGRPRARGGAGPAAPSSKP